MSEKASFVLYGEIEAHLTDVSDIECGKLFRAILQYANRGEVADLTGEMRMAFSFIRAQLDRDQEKWIAVSKKRSEAGAKGGVNSGVVRSERIKYGQADKANASLALIHEANEAVNEYVTDNQYVPVSGCIYGSVPFPVNEVIHVKGTREDWGLAPL